jgi:hypothetical protein
MTTIPQLLDALIATAPDLEALRVDHLREYGEILPHVLFGDLTRWLLAHHPQPRVFQVLEDAYTSGDTNTRDLIAASFVENIEPGSEYAPLQALLGPHLRQLWNGDHA